MMGLLGLFQKKKIKDKPDSEKKIARPVNRLPNKQEISDEQAERLAHALSQYLKNTK